MYNKDFNYILYRSVLFVLYKYLSLFSYMWPINWILWYKTGVENFDMALEHWYEATDYVMEWRRPGLSQGGKNSFFLIEVDKKLNALISGSRKLRKVIEQYDLMETPLPRTPSNMLTWIDDGSLQEQIPLEFNEDLGDQNSSDADSFVSASDNAQLEVLLLLEVFNLNVE